MTYGTCPRHSGMDILTFRRQQFICISACSEGSLHRG